MQTLDNLLSNVSWDKEPDDQIETLKIFDSLTEDQLKELVSAKYIKSYEAGIVIRHLGYARLSHCLSELLEFLQDGNWPVVRDVAKLLASIGKPLIPYIQKVFKKDHEELWNYWILIYIVSDWKEQTIQLLKSDLLALVKRGDKEGAAVEALRILKRCLNESDFHHQYNYLLGIYKGDKYWVDELETVLQ
ncbi:hypothetical protein DC498_16515 [Terrimonas sp.]|uniref:DUF5071 domain-containing protein n=1 Tax=Terrimonas sp. TaxID=1914338 RepID=UPI000D518E79|nr:DUF5071 domain-containing protein [Terrimonas sp.]PVD51024.1 hypothetical protein DC498_16515 [Terrimonas sp.]